MNAVTSTPAAAIVRTRRRLGDRIGDLALHGLTAAATLAAFVLLGGIGLWVLDGAEDPPERWKALERLGRGS